MPRFARAADPAPPTLGAPVGVERPAVADAGAGARLDVTFALAIAVVEQQGRPVQPAAWVEAQIAGARRLYEPLGVHFRWTVGAPLDARFANLVTRTDRDAVGEASFVGKTITIAVVGSLGDVDEPGRARMGVCWQSRVDAKKRYLVLSSIARPTVLAHELGHFFGNPHSAVVNNVMSYSRTDGADVFFDESQMAIVKRTAVGYLARGVLVEALEPVRVREATEHLVAPVMQDDRLGDDTTEPRHSLREPTRKMPAVKR